MKVDEEETSIEMASWKFIHNLTYAREYIHHNLMNKQMQCIKEDEHLADNSIKELHRCR